MVAGLSALRSPAPPATVRLRSSPLRADARAMPSSSDGTGGTRPLRVAWTSQRPRFPCAIVSTHVDTRSAAALDARKHGVLQRRQPEVPRAVDHAERPFGMRSAACRTRRRVRRMQRGRDDHRCHGNALSLLERARAAPVERAVGVHWDALSGLVDPLAARPRSAPPPGTVQFIGVSENTAVATDGAMWRVFGSGVVDIRRGRERLALRDGDQFPR